jgi:hypothetical protein
MHVASAGVHTGAAHAPAASPLTHSATLTQTLTGARPLPLALHLRSVEPSHLNSPALQGMHSMALSPQLTDVSLVAWVSPHPVRTKELSPQQGRTNRSIDCCLARMVSSELQTLDLLLKPPSLSKQKNSKDRVEGQHA